MKKQKAKSKNLKNCDFAKFDINYELLNIQTKFDLIFANASIHWIENQNKLFKEVSELLNKNGIFAAQLPLGKSSIFHQNLEKLAQEYGLNSRIFYALNACEYYDILQNYFKEVEIWQSTYYHILESLDEVIEWYKGSGLRPYLEKLDENLQIKFIKELKVKLAPFFHCKKIIVCFYQCQDYFLLQNLKFVIFLRFLNLENYIFRKVFKIKTYF